MKPPTQKQKQQEHKQEHTHPDPHTDYHCRGCNLSAQSHHYTIKDHALRQVNPTYNFRSLHRREPKCCPTCNAKRIFGGGTTIGYLYDMRARINNLDCEGGYYSIVRCPTSRLDSLSRKWTRDHPMVHRESVRWQGDYISLLISPRPIPNIRGCEIITANQQIDRPGVLPWKLTDWLDPLRPHGWTLDQAMTKIQPRERWITHTQVGDPWVVDRTIIGGVLHKTRRELRLVDEFGRMPDRCGNGHVLSGEIIDEDQGVIRTQSICTSRGCAMVWDDPEGCGPEEEQRPVSLKPTPVYVTYTPHPYTYRPEIFRISVDPPPWMGHWDTWTPPKNPFHVDPDTYLVRREVVA